MEPNGDEVGWIDAAQQGDHTAFAQLVDTYKQPVYNIAYRMLGNAAEAEDAAQEVFLRAYLKLASYDRTRKFSTWLLTITSNYCIDVLRRRRVSFVTLDDVEFALESREPDPEQQAVEHEQRDIVMRAIDALPPAYRLPAVLRFYHDLPYDEIEHITGLTEATVKTRLFRARRMLKEKLEHQGALPWSARRRPLIARMHILTDAERRQLDTHINACHACQDETLDPIGIGVARLALPQAMPSPDFTRTLLLRLTAEAPIAIATRERSTRRVYQRVGIGLAAILGALAVPGLITIQLVNRGAAGMTDGAFLAPALAAKAILITLGQYWLTFLVIAVVLALMALAPRLLEGFARPPIVARRSVFAAGALMIMLVLGNAVALRGDVGTLVRTVDVTDAIQGDVASVAGDINVRGEVDGDVVALGGHVVLHDGATVHGSVLSGAGVAIAPTGNVDQHVLSGPEQLPALGFVLGATTPNTTLDDRLMGIAGVMVTLVALVLATLVVIAWPQGLTDASTMLLLLPGRAVVVGTLAALGYLVVGVALMIAFAATVMGVLLVPMLILILHLPFIAGVAAVGQAFGQRLVGRITVGSALWGVAIQVILLLSIALLSPYASALVFFILGGIGLGGMILSHTAVGKQQYQ